MGKSLDELSLSELFVLAACGKLSALQGADDLGRLPTTRRLHDGSEPFHGPVEDAPTLRQVEDALIEQGLKEGGGNNSASQTSSDSSVAFFGHGNPPAN
jgi:hypothetical protein